MPSNFRIIKTTMLLYILPKHRIFFKKSLKHPEIEKKEEVSHIRKINVSEGLFPLNKKIDVNGAGCICKWANIEKEVFPTVFIRYLRAGSYYKTSNKIFKKIEV